MMLMKSAKAAVILITSAICLSANAETIIRKNVEVSRRLLAVSACSTSGIGVPVDIEVIDTTMNNTLEHDTETQHAASLTKKFKVVRDTYKYVHSELPFTQDKLVPNSGKREAVTELETTTFQRFEYNEFSRNMDNCKIARNEAQKALNFK